MVRIITFQSAREGTGKSTITANVAALLAAEGQRVGVVDAHIASGGLNGLFALPEAQIQYTLNDYLLGMCSASAAVYDVTSRIERRDHDLNADGAGQLFLLPAGNNQRYMRRLLQEGYSIELITDGLLELAEHLDLDVLLLDPQAGLQDDLLLSFLSMAIADTLVIVLRLDHGDYQGTGVLIDIARTLGIPQIRLVINQIVSVVDPAIVGTKIEQTYNCPVVGTLPHIDAITVLGGGDLFVARQPQHPATGWFRQLMKGLIE